MEIRYEFVRKILIFWQVHLKELKALKKDTALSNKETMGLF